jgi:hypothetical protein
MILTETMSTSPTAKKCYVILAISLLDNYVPSSLLPVIRATFMPAPEYGYIQIRLRTYSLKGGNPI